MNDSREDTTIHDLAIVGCGPAGLSAAVNASITKTDFMIFGSEFCSPKMYKAPKINNYLGFYDLKGGELRNSFLDHVKRMGIELNQSKIDTIFPQEDYYTLLARDAIYHAYSVILAVGVSHTKYLDGEEQYLGRGVSYCVTCDGPLFRGRTVAVIAYTEEGIEETESLAQMVEKVYFLPQFDFDGELPSNINVIESKPSVIKGEAFVKKLELDNKTLDVDGVFIYREVTPPDKLIPVLELDGHHIKVNQDMETNHPGVYAAGDCTGTPYQLAKAVGQGQIAALNVAKYVREKKRK